MSNPIVNRIKNAIGNVINPVGTLVVPAAKGVNSATGNQAGKALTSADNSAGQASGLGKLGSDISSITGFASALGNKTLWVRVAKVTIGGSILIVGIMHLTGADGKIA